jgi:hypothetical protein
MNTWNKKDLWSTRGKDYMVQISRHTVDTSSYAPHEGVNRWAVYAYIYPKHRHFGRFEGSDMWQDAASVLPLHAGPSYLRIHRDEEGNITSYQVGADYYHMYDDRFADYADLEDAYEVKRDAQELFDWLKPLDEEL